MRIDIIVKVLIANFVVLFSLTTEAWTVSEWIVDSPLDQKKDPKITKSLALAIPPASHPNLLPQRSENFSTAQFEKRERPLTSEEEALSDYRSALQCIEHGEWLQAERLLRSVLIQSPVNHAARVELATLYLKRNQLEESEILLSDGLRLDENHPDFLRLMAVIHDRREEPERALALLVKVKDSRKQDKNYVAFLGHIYQQMGRYALARQQYYRLLQAEPENSLWLLGVSIALDAEGQKDAALEGYKKLVIEGNIDSHVLEYVQDRIAILKG